MFIMFSAVMILLLRLFPTTSRKDKSKQLVPRHEFVFREGRMDLTGTRWIIDLKLNRMNLPDISANSLQGWYNFILLQGVFFIIASFYKNYSTTGSFLTGHLLLSNIIADFPAAVFWGVVIWLYSFLAWLTQVLIIWIPQFHSKLAVLQHVINVLLPLSIWALCYSKVHWPWSQKLALQVHSWVCCFKMHSYLLVNEELRSKVVGAAEKTESEALFSETMSEEQLDSYLKSNGVQTWTIANKRVLQKTASFIHNVKVQRQNCWPNNIKLWDYFIFTCMPLMCYEPLYPRTTSIRWWYLLEKALVGLCMLSIMWTIVTFSQPILMGEGSELDVMIRLNVPMSFLLLSGFVMVFDVILNFLAEMTYFGDRCFYEDWWNSCTFKEFSRKWNRPVYEFLHRHIYIAGIEKLGISRKTALFGTFLFSIFVHEIILTGSFHKVRPFLTAFSLMQLPLYKLMDVPLFRKNRFGNFFVLGSLIVAFPMISVMYARGYCEEIKCQVD